MRFLAFEFLHCDADIAAALPSSMRREGETMLLALLDDLSQIEGAGVDVLVDPEITDYDRFLSLLPRSATVLETRTQRLISRLSAIAADYDAVIPIAPESSGILLSVADAIRSAGGSALLPSQNFIRIAGNKWRTFLELSEAGIPTVETQFLQDVDVSAWSRFASAAGCLVKPTDGAGSEGIRKVMNAETLARLHNDLRDSGQRRWLVQPLISAMHVSAGVLCGPWRFGGPGNKPREVPAQFEVLPICEQLFEPGSTFTYRGGRIPADLTDDVRRTLRSTAISVCRKLNAQTGYVGIDMLVPDDVSQPIQVVDINPRMTTSYVGYKLMCTDNLTARQLGIGDLSIPLKWKSGLTFPADGSLLQKSATV